MNAEPRTLYEIVAVAQARMDAIEQRKLEQRRAEDERANREHVSDLPAQRPKTDRPHAVTVPEIEEVLKIVAKEMAADRARHDALAKRVAELEAVPQLTDGGTWNAEKVFKPGMVATFDGSAWVCQQVNANARPGSSDAWRLMIKKGRDARDRR